MTSSYKHYKYSLRNEENLWPTVLHLANNTTRVNMSFLKLRTGLSTMQSQLCTLTLELQSDMIQFTTNSDSVLLMTAMSCWEDSDEKDRSHVKWCD